MSPCSTTWLSNISTLLHAKRILAIVCVLLSMPVRTSNVSSIVVRVAICFVILWSIIVSIQSLTWRSCAIGWSIVRFSPIRCCSLFRNLCGNLFCAIALLIRYAIVCECRHLGFLSKYPKRILCRHILPTLHLTFSPSSRHMSILAMSLPIIMS